MFYWIFSKSFFENNENPENAVRLAVEYPFPQSKTAFKHQVEAIKAFNCQEGLSGITSKTMILCGEKDLLFSPEESLRVLQAIPGAEFSVVKRAAHAMFLEKPDETTNLILNFLKS